MRLPGSAGLLSVLGVAGLGTTFSARCFIAWLARVMLFSMILLVTVTRIGCRAVGSCLGGDFLPPCSVGMATDSLFSCNVTEAIWSVGGHEQLARLCASMLLIARQVTDVLLSTSRPMQVTLSMSLLVVSLRELREVLLPRSLPMYLAFWLVVTCSVPWEWLHGLPPAARDAYPPLCDGCFVFDEARSSVEPCGLVKSDAPDVDGDACSTDVIACVRFGSFNVCTLGDSGSRSKFVAGRPALIRRQVRELGVNLLGVQEARSAAGACIVDGYVVLAPGADRGTLGCELWADTENPYASIDGKDYCFRQSDFVAIFASPRVLVVRITARCLQCTVVVAHAPHSGVDASARGLRWDDLSCRLARQPDVVMLVDADARLGSAVSKSVGSGGFCQQEDHSGSLFHRTLVELGLCVPATFGPVDSSAFTWVANGGSTHRIDYVAVPCTWHCGHWECSRHSVAPREARGSAPCSLHVVDSAGDWEDHFLVVLRFNLAIRWAPHGTQWKVEGVDRAALKDPACCYKFKVALRAVKPPPWSMSADEHERFAASAVRRAAKAAFGSPANRPRREHIDGVAWALICDTVTDGPLRLGVVRGVSLPPRGVLPLVGPPTPCGCTCGPPTGEILPPVQVVSSVNLLPMLHLWPGDPVSSAGCGSPSGSSCATVVGYPRSISRRLVLLSLSLLRASLMPHRLTRPMILLGVSSARSPAGAGLSGRVSEPCRVGPVRTVLLPPLPRRSLVLFSGTSQPLKLRRFALSSLLPTGIAAHALHSLLVL